MSGYKAVGTTSMNLQANGQYGITNFNPMLANTATDAVANGAAFLSSELEKRDNLIREPLKSLTYPRDMPIRVGGGWVETLSALNIDYGVAGGSGDGLVHAPGANSPTVIQANLEKDIYKTHIFSIVMRIMYVDMQRSAVTGRSLEMMLSTGIRNAYDKHMDQNVYIGMPQYNTVGLINNPLVTAVNVVNGSAGTPSWATKTPDEILNDVNTAILDCWAAGEYDLSAIPNHIILPYEQYNYIAVTRVSQLAEKTILNFLEENNVARHNGSTLTMGGVSWLKGAGAGGTDRMVTYRRDPRFIVAEELVPLQRIMTQPNIDALAYDSAYMANLSEVEVFYTQPIRYSDGI